MMAQPEGPLTVGSEPALDLSVFSPRRDEYPTEEGAVPA